MARGCGGTPIGFCSGWDDPQAIKALAQQWNVRPCLDVETGIRGDGAWVQGWLDLSGAGLYGNLNVHAARRAAFHILGRYPVYDPHETWYGMRPIGPCGWQWQGTHGEFGASVDRGWYDDWFGAAPAPQPHPTPPPPTPTPVPPVILEEDMGFAIYLRDNVSWGSTTGGGVVVPGLYRGPLPGNRKRTVWVGLAQEAPYSASPINVALTAKAPDGTVLGVKKVQLGQEGGLDFEVDWVPAKGDYSLTITADASNLAALIKAEDGPA